MVAPRPHSAAQSNSTTGMLTAKFPKIIHTMWKSPKISPPAETTRWKKVRMVPPRQRNNNRSDLLHNLNKLSEILMHMVAVLILGLSSSLYLLFTRGASL